MTSTDDINSHLKNIQEYIGCYPCDKIPHVLNREKPAFLVINTDCSDKEGDHWVGLALYNEECLYFDSFGLPVINPYIMEYIYQHQYDSITYSSELIQAYYTENCGSYVIAFILSLHSGITFGEFVSFYNLDDVEANSNICLNLIKTLI